MLSINSKVKIIGGPKPLDSTLGKEGVIVNELKFRHGPSDFVIRLSNGCQRMFRSCELEEVEVKPWRRKKLNFEEENV
jgi:hypothetical protein